MQIRELGVGETDDAYALLCILRPDLSADSFDAFLKSASPHAYRPLGAFERGVLCVYAGVSLHENLELGRYLLIDDFVASGDDQPQTEQMLAYICDYAKFHGCKNVVLWGKQRGIKLEDLKDFRPKRDGFIKTL